jgi:hypothetical protein
VAITLQDTALAGDRVVRQIETQKYVRPTKVMTTKILKWFLLYPMVSFICLLLLWMAHGEILKYYWDRKLKLLCSSTPSTEIFIKEKIKVDGRNIRGGHLWLPTRSEWDKGSQAKYVYKKGDPYYINLQRKSLRKGYPAVEVITIRIVRAEDRFILGKSTLYIRTGGDAIPIDSSSTFSCGGSELDLYEKLFFKMEKPQGEYK